MAENDETIARCTPLLAAIRGEVNKALVGQERMVDGLLIALMTGGHILLEGVPGLAKTTAVRALAAALGLETRRISFTPDLLPADVIGSLVYNQREGTFTPHKGPVFANLLIADEINRAPAKVQSALLEAMQERQVTLGDATYPPSWSWPPRTPSSRRAPTRCPRRRPTASCSSASSATPAARTSGAS